MKKLSRTLSGNCKFIFKFTPENVNRSTAEEIDSAADEIEIVKEGSQQELTSIMNEIACGKDFTVNTVSSSLRLRDGDGKIIGKLAKGNTVTVSECKYETTQDSSGGTEKNHYWFKVTDKDGKSLGWTSAEYLKLVVEKKEEEKPEADKTKEEEADKAKTPESEQEEEETVINPPKPEIPEKKKEEEMEPKNLSEALVKAKKEYLSAKKAYDNRVIKSRTDFANFQKNHDVSEKKFFMNLNHDDFDFNGFTLYGTSKKAQVNRMAFSNLVKKISWQNKSYMPQTAQEFKEFVNIIGKEAIEDYEAGDKNVQNSVAKYFKSKTPESTLSEKELDALDDDVREKAPMYEELRKIDEYVKEGDFDKTLVLDLMDMDKIVAYLPDNLTNLYLRDTQITDKGLKEVSKLKNLTSLDIGDTQITDEGLKEVSKLKNLTHLFISGTQVTDEGLAKLKEKLPNCDLIAI